MKKAFKIIAALSTVGLYAGLMGGVAAYVGHWVYKFLESYFG